VVFHNMGGGTDVPATDDQFITMQVFDTRNGHSSLTNPPDVAGQGYFHRRGQATFWDPKPNLRVETQDEYGNDLHVSLLGMPAESDWVFYGIDTYDKVLMHNPLIHDLYREMGHYSSRTRYVEVYIDLSSGNAGPITKADYYGLYVLEEKIKIGKNRLDIDKLQPENTNAPSVTGGYLLSIDKSNPGDPAYLAGVRMWYLDPDYYTITLPERAAQKDYIDGYFNDFYAALTGPNWKGSCDRLCGLHRPEFMDRLPPCIKRSCSTWTCCGSAPSSTNRVTASLCRGRFGILTGRSPIAATIAASTHAAGAPVLATAGQIPSIRTATFSAIHGMENCSRIGFLAALDRSLPGAPKDGVRYY
jgi:hypothetical protein